MMRFALSWRYAMLEMKTYHKESLLRPGDTTDDERDAWLLRLHDRRLNLSYV